MHSTAVADLDSKNDCMMESEQKYDLKEHYPLFPS